MLPCRDVLDECDGIRQRHLVVAVTGLSVAALVDELLQHSKDDPGASVCEVKMEAFGILWKPLGSWEGNKNRNQYHLHSLSVSPDLVKSSPIRGMKQYMHRFLESGPFVLLCLQLSATFGD